MSSSIKKIIVAVFTGNRAEYGLQFPILRAIQKHQKLQYRLIVSNTHLSRKFGETVKEIKKDGFKIHAKIKFCVNGNSLEKTPEAIGKGILSISRILKKFKPNFIIVYADRFEGFAAVVAATQMNIPTVHIEGGDITQGGTLDDSVRHAMTKLAHLHFTTNKTAARNIISMGEEPWRVHRIGLPMLDLIKEKNYASAKEIRQKIKINLNKPIVIFTHHPVTINLNTQKREILSSVKAILHLAKADIQVIVTYPNNDAGSNEIITHIKKLQNKTKANIFIVKSLGRYYYHGLLSLAKKKKHRIACVGNSSSGLKETPAFCCPAVNIGSRQDGRLRGKNVIDTYHNAKSIVQATKKCLFDSQFRELCKNASNPYDGGMSGKKAASILARNFCKKTLLVKKHFVSR